MPGTQTDSFTAVLHLPASPEAVSALFTSAAGVGSWWGPTTGDAAVGGTLISSFGEYGVNAMRVLESGPARVVWESIAADGTTPTGHTKEWLGTTMEFDIAEAEAEAEAEADADAEAGAGAGTGAGTELRFRHAGLTPRLDCFDSCVAAWTYFLSSIEAVATTGTGTPFGT